MSIHLTAVDTALSLAHIFSWLLIQLCNYDSTGNITTTGTTSVGTTYVDSTGTTVMISKIGL